MIGKLIYCAKHRENGWERAFQWAETNIAESEKAYVLSALKEEQSRTTNDIQTSEPANDTEVNHEAA